MIHANKARLATEERRQESFEKLWPGIALKLREMTLDAINNEQYSIKYKPTADECFYLTELIERLREYNYDLTFVALNRSIVISWEKVL